LAQIRILFNGIVVYDALMSHIWMKSTNMKLADHQRQTIRVKHFPFPIRTGNRFADTGFLGSPKDVGSMGC
jgi:hypothetical protein